MLAVNVSIPPSLPGGDLDPDDCRRSIPAETSPLPSPVGKALAGAGKVGLGGGVTAG